MKILILANRDTGGTGYTLAHAINKVTPENQAVNIRGMNTFIAYPTIVDMADYSRSSIRQMIYGSDVIIFLEALAPFFEAFNLQKKQLKDKKKILLCMGSEWRWGRRQLIKQADRFLGNYKIVLGGADMFQPLDFTNPETNEQVHFDAVDESSVGYLPVVRSFDEITEKYGVSKPDQAALESFAVPKRKVVFTHAPTSEANKGSHIFYRAVTRAQQACSNLCFQSVIQQTWHATLGILARSDVLLDQAPPFPTAYGALSVEAGIFKLPAFSQVAPECRDFILRHTGLKTPHIVFSDEEDLFRKVATLAVDEKLRRTFGLANYDFCRQVHDEKPVVDRLLKIIEEMN
jgi:hypothetical protein